jgi:RNA polymerase sigma-70 factor (ECF subfamily)
MSDEGLVSACAVGDGAALGALFDRHFEAVRGFLARSAGTDERDLDDLVQLTFAEVPRAARRFDRRAQVRTWLLGIATNIVRHHVRAEIRRKRLSGAVAASPRPTAVDGAAALLEQERSARLHQAILDLPEKLREPFVLVYLEGVAGRDVAQLLGLHEGTLWKRLHQGRALLREALGGGEP